MNNSSNMSNAFGQRLRSARLRCGLSQGEVIRQMKTLAAIDPSLFQAVSSTALERYENGVMMPSEPNVISTLAHILHTTTDQLNTPVQPLVFGTFEFRKKTKLGVKAQERIKEQVKINAEFYYEIEQITDTLNEGIQAFQKLKDRLNDILVKCADDARMAAVTLRAEWHLGLNPIARPIDLLERQGIKVMEVYEDPDLFDGTSCMVNDTPILIINGNISNNSNEETGGQKGKAEKKSGSLINNQERRNLTLFHELGHALLNISEELTEKECEKVCHAFASEVLIPTERLIEIFGPKRSKVHTAELKEVQNCYGISVRALMYKLSEVGIINDNQYKWFNINLNKSGNEEYRAKVDSSGWEIQRPWRFIFLVFRAIDNKTITRDRGLQMFKETHIDYYDAA